MLPHGRSGRVFAWLMDWLNRPAYRRAAALLDPAPGDSILEIGFGTGGLAARLAPRLGPGQLAGVDPSPLMVSQARRRLERLGLPVRIDLRQGTDADLDWPALSFSHVAALHSFQFWKAPERTLPRLWELLQPGGRLLLILRAHGSRAPPWLANPVSRSGAEVEGTVQALREAGFAEVARHAPVGRSVVITARRARV